MSKKFLLIIVIFLFSCSKRITYNTSENIYTKGFDTKNIEFIDIYKNNDNIYIESRYRDKYIFFSGDILNVSLKNNIDQRVFANRIIKLNKKDYNDEIFKKIKNNKNTEKINIIRYNDWSKIILPVLENVLISIVPDKKNEAIVISIANNDMAVFYNDKKMIVMEKVEKLDKNMKIIKLYREKEFYEILAKEVKKIKKVKSKIKNNLLVFEIKGNSETNSPYVLFDTETNLLYYFDYSATFKLKESVNNLDYYIQLIFNAVIKAHIIEPIKSPITTAKKASTFVFQGIKKTFESKRIKDLKKIPPLNNTNKMMDINNFENKLDKILGKKKYKGSMEYLIGGSAFFSDFINEIENSNDEIFIRLYIYSNDDYGVRLSNLLKNKSNNGVDVRILTGGLANNVESMKKSLIPFDKNFKQPRSIGQYLSYNSNVNFRTTADTFFIFDHSKMIIIDKKLAYVGGMNIGQPYRYSWHDMMIKLKGPIVYEVYNKFNEAWTLAGPTGDLGKFFRIILNQKKPSKELEEYYNLDKEKQINIRILYTKPQNKGIYKAQLLAIKNAKKRIYIQNPYLADYKIINALIEARGRGVDVRIIMPSKNNVNMMTSSNLVATNIFLRNGIKVYSYQGMTHIKAAIYDGWATLGSANFDNLSLMINDEFNIAFSDPYYVNKLEEDLFNVDFKLSKEITKPYIINWHDKLMSGFANRF